MDVVHLMVGNNAREVDLKGKVCGVITRSTRYKGAVPHMYSDMTLASLKSILCGTFSQCRSFSGLEI